MEWLSKLNEAEMKYSEGATLIALSLYLEVLKARLSEMALKPLSQAGTLEGWLDTDAHVLERVCDIACAHGEFELAIDALSLASRAAKAEGNTFYWTYSQLRVAEIYFEIEIEDGFWDAILPFESKLGAGDFAPRFGAGLQRVETEFLSVRWHFLYAKWLGKEGKYGLAHRHLEIALQMVKKMPKGSHFSELLIDQERPLKIAQARFHLEQGRTVAADKMIEELLREQDAFDLTEQQLVLEISFQIAFLRGNYGNAIAYGYDLVGLADTAGAIQGRFASRMNLAKVLLLLNQIPDLDAVLGQLDVFANSSQQYLHEIQWLKRLVKLRKETTMAADSPFPLEFTPDEEIQSSYTSVSLKVSGYSYLARFDAAGVDLMELITQRDYPKTQVQLGRMQKEFGDCDSTLMRHRLAVFAWMVGYYFKTQRIDAVLDEASAFFEAEGLLPELFQINRMVLWSGRLQGDSYWKKLEENELVLKQIARSLSPYQAAAYLTNKWTGRELFLAEKLKLFENQWKSFGLAKRLLNIKRVLQEMADIFQEIDQYKWDQITESSHDRATRIATAPNWLRVLQSLKFRSATIVFVSLPDRLVCILMGVPFMQIRKINLTRLRLRELLSGLHGLHAAVAFRDMKANDSRQRDLAWKKSDTRQGGSLEAIKAQLAEIATAIELESLLAMVPGYVRHLTLVADDVLYHLPFAALPVGGEYLVKRYSIALQPRPITLSRNATNSSCAQLLGVSEGFEGLPQLLSVDDEIKQVEAILTKRNLPVVSFMNSEVSSARFISSLSNASIVHVASHGYFSREHPLQSGIAFQGNERLTLAALLDLEQASNVGLVVLTSCWGADSLTLPNRWILSLPEALWLAGAHSVVSNLWPVPDDDVGSFVNAFYENLQQTSTGHALQMAQWAMINDARCNHPFYWAGFQVYGDHFPLGKPSWGSRLRRIFRSKKS